jgi:hypothetical protein
MVASKKEIYPRRRWSICDFILYLEPLQSAYQIICLLNLRSVALPVSGTGAGAVQKSATPPPPTYM